MFYPNTLIFFLDIYGLPTQENINKEHHKVPGISYPSRGSASSPFFELYPLNDFFIWALCCIVLFLSEKLMCKTVLIMLGVGVIFVLVVILMAIIDEYLYGNDR